MADLLVTSGYNFEGYSIVKYLGVYTGECALGTGFLSSLGAGFADFLGSNSEMYSGKLRKAKDYAMRELYDSVKRAGGNAIIGLDIDYSTFSSDIMGVVANGTAVKIVKNDLSKPVTENSETEMAVDLTNIKSPLRPTSVCFKPSSQGITASMEITVTEVCSISGIMADFVIKTIFDESVTMNDLYFLNFNETSRWHYKSGMVECKVDPSVLERAKSVSIVIKKYICDDKVVDVSENSMDLQENVPDSPSEEEADKIGLLHEIEKFKTAREILDYLYLNAPWLDADIMAKLENIVAKERIYGNMKQDIISVLKEYFGPISM